MNDPNDFELEQTELEETEFSNESAIFERCDRCEMYVHDNTSCSDIDCEYFDPRGGS